ncbi:MAG: LLM class flavin-dependent oxidoreductase [Nitrospinae bacterium]|nr:LLM class flavin-dependent oxidoreductase [Nitrospinota bacterium]
MLNDWRTQAEAFHEAFGQMEVAEELNLDGVWLAERHFAAPNRGVGIPSVISAPLIVASAIAARTRRLRVGIAVHVLPLGNPIRMAEEVATIDHISQGRFDFGIGRSGFPRVYEGYNIPYSESRERFQECLEVMLKAWTTEQFSYEGKYYSFHDVCVLPKPYQHPYPPVRIAATTAETFPQVGHMGYPIFVGLRGMTQSDLGYHLKVYREAWQEAGHAGTGDVILRIPIYVAETAAQALRDPEASTMRAYQRLGEQFGRSAGRLGTVASEERVERAQRLSRVTYDDLLAERVAFGTPETVAARLQELREALGLTGVITEVNCGGVIPQDRVLNSLRLFAERVVPQLK